VLDVCLSVIGFLAWCEAGEQRSTHTQLLDLAQASWINRGGKETTETGGCGTGDYDGRS